MSVDRSVIIVTYNSADCIGDCLNSLHFSRKVGSTEEIIVVDNASLDSTRQIVRSRFPDVILHEIGTNIGFAAGANVGFSQSSGRTIVFLNPDTIVRENAIGEMECFLAEHLGAVIVGAKLVDADGQQQPSCWRTPSLGVVVKESFLPYRMSVRLTTQSPNRLEEVDMVSGACLAIRREEFAKLGGFDERFFMFYEDSDLCLRARRSGGSIWFHPAAVVFHGVSKSFATDATNFFILVYQSKVRFFRKHFSKTIALVTLGISVAGICVRVPAYLLAGLLTANRTLLHLSIVHVKIIPRILTA